MIRSESEEEKNNSNSQDSEWATVSSVMPNTEHTETQNKCEEWSGDDDSAFCLGMLSLRYL